jgi:hypothetical protein
MRGLGQFEAILGVKWNSAEKLIDPKNYRVGINDKGRVFQQPLGLLAKVHERIGMLLSKIEVPNYLYSQKCRSSIDNARQHLGDVPLIKTDIHKFYPSISHQMVFRMFLFDFQCAADVANRLADICCYQQQHVPTGSALSGQVAFFAARHMFDEISDLAESHQCTMTAYVDDVTISGDFATKALLAEIQQVVRLHGLKVKLNKSKTYSATAAKEVTGAVIVGTQLRLPNKQHQKIWNAKRELLNATDHEKPTLQRSLNGRLQQASQILG